MMDRLYDDGIGVVVVCAVCIPVVTVLTSLRMWVRWRMNNLGMDDYLLMAGLVLWLVSTAFVFPACWNGLGAHAGRYTAAQGTAARKYFFFFQDFYVWANIPIKISLCLTLIRLSARAPVRWLLYGLCAVVLGSSVGSNAYLLTNCRPFDAVWNVELTGAACRPPAGQVTLGNVYSAINIAVDWIVALLPVHLLWRLQMAWRQKLTVMMILSLGIFASTATLIRLGTLSKLADPDDYLFGIGKVTLWTVLELALALTAGSLYSLKPLVRRWFGGHGCEAEHGLREPHDCQSSFMRHKFQRTKSVDTSSVAEVGLATMISGRSRCSRRRDDDNDNNNSNNDDGDRNGDRNGGGGGDSGYKKPRAEQLEFDHDPRRNPDENPQAIATPSGLAGASGRHHRHLGTSSTCSATNPSAAPKRGRARANTAKAAAGIIHITKTIARTATR